MSDAAPGPDWWLASDGQWYPPPAPGGATHHGDPGGGARQVAENWQRGADGEAATARELTRLTVGYRVFHDLKVPGAGKANIDHLVLGPSGVWLIDTKAWSGELTPGKGTLWRGRTPIQKEIDQVEWQAEMVAERLGADVNPMLCFVGTALPRPAQMVQRTRVVALDALVDHIVRAPQVLLPQDVDALDHWARTMQVSSPRQADRRPARQPAAAHPLIPTPATPGAAVYQMPAPPKQRSGPVVGCLATIGALVVLGIGLLFVLGLVFARSTSETTTRAGQPPGSVPGGTQLSAPSTTVPGDLKVEVECPIPGLGWSLVGRATFLSGSTLRATATINGIPAFLGELRSGRRSEPLKGLQPNQAVGIDVQAVDRAGQVERQWHLDVVTPSQPC